MPLRVSHYILIHDDTLKHDYFKIKTQRCKIRPKNTCKHNRLQVNMIHVNAMICALKTDEKRPENGWFHNAKPSGQPSVAILSHSERYAFMP